MKTTYTKEDIASFLGTVERADPSSITPLTEGHISQAFSFQTKTGDKLVLRISDKEPDFIADKYAADNFGSTLLVPRVTDLKRYDDKAFYCVSELASGKTTNVLTDEEMEVALPSIQQALASIYNYDISQWHGYGHIDTSTGDAKHDTWKSALGDEIEEAGVQAFRDNAQNIGLDPAIVDKFFPQFRDNLMYASEVRRLFHGDPAFDNMLVDGDKVTAVIDWAQMGYGDWMSDFARLDFWWPGRYGDAKSFAKQYGLDDNNLDQRVALYWATNALWTIEFADKAKSDGVTLWLKEHLHERLV